MKNNCEDSTAFYASRVFDVMKKAFDITLGVIADLEDVMQLLKTDMGISDSDKNEDLQKIISLLDEASKLVIEAVIVLWKYESL